MLSIRRHIYKSPSSRITILFPSQLGQDLCWSRQTWEKYKHFPQTILRQKTLVRGPPLEKSWILFFKTFKTAAGALMKNLCRPTSPFVLSINNMIWSRNYFLHCFVLKCMCLLLSSSFWYLCIIWPYQGEGHELWVLTSFWYNSMNLTIISNGNAAFWNVEKTLN